MTELPSAMRIEPTGDKMFSLVVIVDGQPFECGSYISRAAAQQAGKLFIERKEGEAEGRRKRPRRK